MSRLHDAREGSLSNSIRTDTTYYWYPTSECHKVARDCCESSSCSEQRDCAACWLPPCPLQQGSPAPTVICTHKSKQKQHTRTHLQMWRKADTQTPTGECDRALSVWAGKHIKDKNESGMPAVALEASGGEKQSTARSAARWEHPWRVTDCWWSFPKGFYCGEVGFRAFSGA